MHRSGACSQPEQSKRNPGAGADLRPGYTAGRGIRHRISHLNSRVCLSLRRSLQSVSASPHPAVWFSRHVTPVRCVSLPRVAWTQPRSNEHHHTPPWHGCSAAAIRAGHALDTSMGMTPLEGLMMGTRSGDLDPAIVSLIANKEGL